MSDFLLGRSDRLQTDQTEPVSPQLLPVLHGKPVWSPMYGWMLVNAIDKKLICPDGSMLSFSDAIKHRCSA